MNITVGGFLTTVIAAMALAVGGAVLAPGAVDQLREKVTQDVVQALTGNPNLEAVELDPAHAEARATISQLELNEAIVEVHEDRRDATCEAIYLSTGIDECGIERMNPVELAEMRAARGGQ